MFQDIDTVTLPMRTNQIKCFLSNNGIRGFGDGLRGLVTLDKGFKNTDAAT